MDVSSMFDDRKSNLSFRVPTADSVWFEAIGFGLTGFGLFFMFLGVMMLFDRALLAMGNVNRTLTVRNTAKPLCL